jgi:hypothetical protein
MALQLRQLYSDPGRVIQPGLFLFLDSRGVGCAVLVGFHHVAGHLKMLTGMVMGVMQQFHKVRYAVGHGPQVRYAVGHGPHLLAC